jgi:hypothetical protein
LSPLGREHINLIGDDVCAGGNQVTKNPDGFRPFRPPSEPARLAVSVRDLSAYATEKCRSFVGADLAESELGVLSCQWLDRRIPDKQILIDKIAAWEQDRNTNHIKANWHFKTPDARIKLKHLYPSI